MRDESSIIERYAIALCLLLAVGVALFLLYRAVYAEKDLTIATIYTGIATSIIAAVIYTLLNGLLVERYHLRVVSRTLVENVEKKLDDVKQAHEEGLRRVTQETVAKLEEVEKSYFHEISSRFHEFVPADYFPPTNEPDRRFNVALNAALVRSHLYFFKGVTGRHIPLRIEAMQPRSLTCKVLLIDPRRDDLLWTYAKSRFANLTSKDELINCVRREIYMSVVAMFDVAKLSPIEIKLYEGPVFYRTEIFDEQVFVSYFTSDLRTAYPVTYAYNKGTHKYDAYLKDFHDSLELRSPSITFNVNSTVEDLFFFLDEIGCVIDDIAPLRQEAEVLKKHFITKLK